MKRLLQGYYSASIKRSILFGAVSLVCCTLLACDSQQSEIQPIDPPLRPVKVLEITPAQSALERTLAATVISADSQNLSFRVSGTITKLPVNVGDRLSADTVVASLDQQPFLLSAQEARASRAQAEANYRNAQSQYQRTRDLYATEAASLSDLENAKASASSARASRAIAQEGVNAAQLNIEYTELRNTVDNCQVVSVPASVNQFVTAGQTIATLACGNQLRARTMVPESLINNIRTDMSVTTTLQSGNIKLTGKVVEVAVSSTDNTGYGVEIELISPPPTVIAGMAAQVTFNFPSNDQRFLVPLNAVLADSSSKFIYIAEPDGDHYRIAKQEVQTGPLDSGGIEILQGVTPGQQVVVAGMSRVSEGMQVTLYTIEQ